MSMRTSGRKLVGLRSPEPRGARALRRRRDLRGLAAVPMLLGLLALAPLSFAAPTPAPKRRPPPAAKPVEPKCVGPDTPLDPQGPPEELQRRGQCEEVGGHFVAALELYEMGLRKLPPAALAKQLQARILAVIPQLGTVRVEAGAWPAGTRVRIGSKTTEAGGGGARTVREWVDPGRVEVEVEAPGFKKDKQVVEIAKGEEKVVTLAAPAASPVEPSPPPVAPTSGPATVAATSSPALRPVEGGSVLRPLGYVGLTVGGAALIAGGVTGYLALDRGRVVRSECPTPSTCSADGAASARAGASFSTASTIAVIGGAVLTLGGLALIYFGGPKTKTIAGFVFAGGV